MSNFVSVADKKKNKTMAEVTARYEEFIKDKEVDSKGVKLFNKVIKKVSKPKLKK